MDSRLTACRRAMGKHIMFDSPFEYCPVCRQYVLLDQTHRECAHEHGCGSTAACPLQRLFTGIDFAKKSENKGAKRGRRNRPKPST